MKNANKLSSSLILISAAAAGLFVLALAQQNTSISAASNIDASMQTVTISAKRLSPQEKIAYDQTASAQPIQTVLISAKRMSAQEKLAMDKENARSAQANAQFNRSMRKIA